MRIGNTPFRRFNAENSRLCEFESRLEYRRRGSYRNPGIVYMIPKGSVKIANRIGSEIEKIRKKKKKSKSYKWLETKNRGEDKRREEMGKKDAMLQVVASKNIWGIFYEFYDLQRLHCGDCGVIFSRSNNGRFDHNLYILHTTLLLLEYFKLGTLSET